MNQLKFTKIFDIVVQIEILSNGVSVEAIDTFISQKSESTFEIRTGQINKFSPEQIPLNLKIKTENLKNNFQVEAIKVRAHYSYFDKQEAVVLNLDNYIKK